MAPLSFVRVVSVFSRRQLSRAGFISGEPRRSRLAGVARPAYHPATVRDRVTTGHGGLTYKFGWFVAWSGLTSAVSPRPIKDFGDALEIWGPVVGATILSSNLIMGVAAATVRPWSWYVLLVYQLLLPIWGGLYITIFQTDWKNSLMVALFALGWATICFAYFYKRRALFRARWRWQWLERSWPRLVGPETVNPDARRGFGGLSPLGRRLFVAATAIGMLAQQL